MPYDPETQESSNSLHFLVGSDQSIRYINHENTTVHSFTEDPLVDFCIEHTQKDGKTERMYTGDGRLAFVLSSLGYKTVQQQYAPEEHVVGYEIAGHFDGQGLDWKLEWDVLDYDGKTSLVLKHFADEPKTKKNKPPNDPDVPISPIDDISFLVELTDGEIEVHHGNTEVVIFDKDGPHHRYSHVRIELGRNNEGVALFKLIFNDPRLRNVLRRKRFSSKRQLQIMDPALIKRLASNFASDLDEDQASSRFELTIEGDDINGDSALQ